MSNYDASGGVSSSTRTATAADSATAAVRMCESLVKDKLTSPTAAASSPFSMKRDPTGDELADEHDVDIFQGNLSGRTLDTNKQLDPVNFDPLDRDPWREEVFWYVSRLVKFRTRSDALAVDDTTFIHVDFDDGKRVLVWKRAREGADDPVLVVANVSDWGTADPTNPAAEYVVSNWQHQQGRAGARSRWIFRWRANG